MKSLEITTMIGCPLMCTFCPQDKLQRAYKDPVRVLTKENLQIVLEKLTPDVHIVFAGYTEPWANRDCNQFVRMVLERGHNIDIYSTLYGITVEKCKELVKLLTQYRSQVKNFWIHLPDSRGNMPGWRASDEYTAVLQMIRSSVPCNDMTMDADGQVDPAIKVETNPVNWYLHTRADNLDVSRIHNQPVHEPPKYEFVVECTRNKNLHSNVLLPNGDVALCCMDYGLKHILGNLLKQSYEEILGSTELEKINRINNQLGYTDEVLCKSCNDGFCRTPWNDQAVYELVRMEKPEILGL